MNPLRERLETLIENAIAMLDQIDGDCDREDDGTAEAYLAGSGSDREMDEADSEPWLSWSDLTDQSKPQQGYLSDLDYEAGSHEWEPGHAA
jgi:hypothetical protein